MAFKRRPGLTSTGLVRVDRESADMIDLLLYDFDIDDATLKELHKQALARALQVMLASLPQRQAGKKPGEKAWTVSIDGYASRTGTAAHNQQLSEMREQSVADYFVYYLAMRPALDAETKIDTNYHGFTDAKVPGEDPAARCVRVVIHGSPVPPPPKPVGPTLAPRDFFCSDASGDVVNVLDRFFSFDQPITVTSVSDMVDKVTRRLDIVPGTKVRNLVIGGHGNEGFQAVGCGTGWDTTGSKSLQVDPDNTDQLLGPAAGAMARLKGRFTDDGGISLMGCHVARGGEGLALLRVVSKTIGAFAQGAVAYQRPLIPGWEGDLYRCKGDTCWIEKPGIIEDW